MVEAKSRFRLITGAAVAAGATLLVGCAPTPVTRTVTTEQVTTTQPRPPVITTITTEVVTPPVRHPVRHAIRTVRRRPTRTDNVVTETKETDETTYVPVAPATMTRTTTTQTSTSH
jgi:hypothetical protein